MRRYPHQLSGGMQQRVVIAMALAKDPALLILDEPTTGLDATVEAEVLDLVSELRQEFQTSVLFISHNLEVIAKMCDRVGVLYAGRLVEEGPGRRRVQRSAPSLHGRPAALPAARRRAQGPAAARHDPGLPAPARRSDLPACVFVDRCGLAQEHLLEGGAAVLRPREAGATAAATSGSRRTSCRARRPPPRRSSRSTMNADPVIRAESLNKTFRQEGNDIRAVDDLNFSLRPGETLGLVGESGSGKTTLARMLLGLIPADEGSIIELDGVAAREADHQARARRRPRAADRLPEPRLGAQPPLLRAAHPQPRAREAARRRRRRARGAPEGARPLGPLRHAPDPLAPGAALGRPEAARRDRPRVRRRAARSSSATSRPRRSTSRCRPRSSTCWPSCRPRRASPTSSSRTTSASCATSPTGSPCSTSAG